MKSLMLAVGYCVLFSLLRLSVIQMQQVFCQPFIPIFLYASLSVQIYCVLMQPNSQ